MLYRYVVDMFWFTSLSYKSRTVSLLIIAFHCTCWSRLSTAESDGEKPLLGHGAGCGMGSDGVRQCGILPKIAVIGAGISGASAAFYLRQLFGGDVSIDIYEKHKIGGRMANQAFSGKEYESGGSIIHPGNAYMVNLTHMFGLRQRDRESSRLGIFDGKQMVFDGSRWGMLTLGQLLWRYGWDIYRMQSFVDKMLANFRSPKDWIQRYIRMYLYLYNCLTRTNYVTRNHFRIYDHQAKGHAFTRVEELLSSMSPDFLRLLQSTLADELRSSGFSEPLIQELVNAGIRCNYGQSTSIHAFVGLVSMAGMQSGLWSVHGGNRLVPERLVNSSEATLLHADVHTIVRQKKLKKSDGDLRLYQLQSFELDGSKKYLSRSYDVVVVVAAPLHDDIAGIQFENFPRPVVKPPQPFHKTVTTFVSGWPNATMFGYRTVGNLPEQVLTSKDGLFFNSLGRQTAVDFKHGEKASTVADADKATGDEATPTADGSSKSDNLKDRSTTVPVWKVFSPAVLTKEQLNSLFLSYNDVRVVDWAAYPKYSSNAKDLPGFELGMQIYYTNAMEMASSTMETCVISGRNVALLAYNRWFDRDDKIGDINDGRELEDKVRNEL